MEGSEGVRELRILIVEDEFLSRQLLGLNISKYGSYDVADNGETAIDSVRRAYESGKPYDLLFMDIVLPIMDGLTALKAIRAYEASIGLAAPSPMKVVMVSALSDSETKMDSFDSQCEAYVTKPYSKGMLESTIERLFEEN
jgi:two-component system, chemotaxis family, chemotaxis protein CheY